MNKYDVIIIGAGPCGIGAALKLKEAGINFAIIDGSTPGGKVNIAPRVDNYPGFKEIPGPDLAFKLFERLMNNGISITGDNILSLTKENDVFKLEGQYDSYEAKAVLVAAGTKERKLGLPKEDELFAHGLSYCALCDGHFFKGQDVAVIGGGNAALKEAIHLAGIAKKLYVIHRRNEFRGSMNLVNELKEMDNVEIITPYIPVEILGEDKVTGLVIENREDGSRRTLDIEGLFPLVGQIPNTQFIKIDGVLNEWGTIPVEKNMMTSCVGLFAGGDVLPRDIRQIYLAEHDGMVASKSIIEYLNK
jgi:thioredoxin reductase (NADPH)